MMEIVRLFYDILLFKKGPEDVPFSPLLTRVTLAVYALVNFLMMAMSSHWFSAVLEMAVDMVMLIIFTRVVLAWVHKPERYQQTFCALLGTDALITLCAIPATATLLIPAGDIPVFGFFIVVGLMLWHWAVIGHILSHALAQHLSFGLGIALLYMMAAYQIMTLLFPPISVSG
jgi:hypothetical protein